MRSRYGLFIWSMLLLFTSSGWSQTAVKPVRTAKPSADTLRLITPADTARRLLALPDSLRADTSANADTLKRSEIDTTVSYFAANIEIFPTEKITLLTGHARVLHKGMELRAHRIRIDWEHDLVQAEGRPDTLWIDSTMTQIDTLVYVETPIFTDFSSGSVDSLRGYKMEMNMTTKRGRVFAGATAIEQGRYRGGTMKRVDDDVMYIKEGTFTSCEQENPHFHFWGRDMKVKYKDKLIARPVVLYFGQIPTMIVPYGIFSLKPGRHSGLIVPSYGESAGSGRYLKHLGYYWAPSDYWDTRIDMDYYEKFGTLWNLSNRYAVRYDLSGELNTSFSDRSTTGGKIKSWVANWSHNQTIDPTSRVSANVNYVSNSTYYKDYSRDLNQRLNQNIRSGILYTKSWPGTRASFSANFDGNQNIQTRDYQISYPSMAFRWSDGPLIPKPAQDVVHGIGGPPLRADSGGVLGVVTRTSDEPAWWETITYGYGVTVSNAESRTTNTTSVTYYDTTGGTVDTIHQTNVSKPVNKTQLARHTLGINSPWRVSKYFTLSHSISLTHDWLPRINAFSVTTRDSLPPLVTAKEQSGFFHRTVFSTSAGLSTKFYGVMDPHGAFGLTAVRHVAQTGLSFVFQPDFSDPKFGYVKRIKDPTTGQFIYNAQIKQHYFDPWAGTAAGATHTNKALSLNFSLNNLFQAKYEVGEETKKIDLFSWDLGTGYNFAADSLKLGDLRMSLRASPFSNGNGFISAINTDLSSSFSPYQFAHSNAMTVYTSTSQTDTVYTRVGNVIDKFEWEKSPTLLHLGRFTGVSGSVAFRWQKPQPPKPKTDPDAKPDTSINLDSKIPEIGSAGGLLEQRNGRVEIVPPNSKWEGNSSLRFTYTKTDPTKPDKSVFLDNTIKLYITPSWSIGYHTTVNLITRDVQVGQIVSSKDLHCWQINFQWSPIGINQGFNLLIAVKNPDLRDLKLERSKGQGFRL